MSPKKEPHYFDTDHQQDRVGNLKDYENLFKKATDNHQVVGEASTRYLSSEVAVENILAYNPEAKFIVCLRNPVKMAPSLHEEELFAGYENVESFEKAWELQEIRNEGKQIPGSCTDEIRLQYGKMCSIGTQCESLLKKVPREKVFFIWLDDLKKDPLIVYKEMLDFLDVKYDGRNEFSAENTAKTTRSKTFQQMIVVSSKLKRKLGIYRSTGIRKWNAKKQDRKPLSQKMEKELKEYFKPEILKLEKILKRDLTDY